MPPREQPQTTITLMAKILHQNHHQPSGKFYLRLRPRLVKRHHLSNQLSRCPPPLFSFIDPKTLKIKGPIETMAAPLTTSWAGSVNMGLLFMLIVLGFFCTESRLVSGDLGTANSYGPPYMPTRCFGSRPDQFPPMYLFVAVSEGLWDGGSACGRLYKIRCLSGPNMPCKGGAIVEVKVVDLCRQSPCPSTIAMSTDAFAAISHSPSARINIEYVQI